MSKHIVLGGTGHLGNVLIKTLLSQGKKVKALLLPNEDLKPLENLDIEIKYGDVRDKNFLLKEIEPNSCVYHLAGIVDIGSKKRSLMYDVNINGTKNVIDTCKEVKVKRLVYTSSVHTIVVKKNNNDLLVEPTVFDKNKVVGDYAKTKTEATKYFFEVVSNSDLDAVIVYPSGIVGPFDYKLSNFGQLVWDYMNKKVLARINGKYNFVDVRDVALGTILAMEKGKKGEGYILGGDVISIEEIFNWLEEKTKIKKPPKLKMWFVKMFSHLAELHYKLRKKRPVFSPYSLYTLTSNSNFSSNKAKKELGYTTRPIKESIFDAVDWFNKNRKPI